MPKIASSLLVVMFCAAVAPWALADDPGPAVGDRFPHDLVALDQNGQERSLESLMGKNGLAVFFVRSADWCPFCKRQLVDVNQHFDAFVALGVNVVTISVDEVPLIADFAKEQSVKYVMLADPKGAINLELGIRDEQYPVGSAAFGVPRPVLYVLDRSRTIRLRYMEPTYRTRPNLEVVLTELAALGLGQTAALAPDVTPTVVTVAATPEPETGLICHEEARVGTHFRRKRCFTPAQLHRMSGAAQDWIRSGGHDGGVAVTH